MTANFKAFLAVLVLLCVVFLLVACGKTVVVNQADGTSVEMPAEEYRAQQAEQYMMNFQSGLGNLLMDCGDPADRNVASAEYTNCIHNNQLVLVQVPYMLREAQGINAGYWNLAAKKEDRPFRIANTAISGIQTLGMMGLLPWGTSFGSGGNSVKISASDHGSISNIDMTTGSNSPFIAGSDNLTGAGKSAVSADEGMAATNDGQNLEGQGNSQAQVQTDPIPGTNFAGDGDQNFQPNSSTGLGF